MTPIMIHKKDQSLTIPPQFIKENKTKKIYKGMMVWKIIVLMVTFKWQRKQV